MHRVTPKIFLVGETQIDREQLKAYLEVVGAPEWHTEAPSDGEELIEVMGRLCYRSWKPGLNKNVTKVREGNDTYLDHIIEVGHGSVIEHAMTNWVIADVSRVFTHELVRHRVGTAFSQESLRFVRLDDLGLWMPPEAETDLELVKMCEEKFRADEAFQQRLTAHLKLDDPGTKFDYKKKWTSFMRRFAPDGLATAIGFSANFRTLRHLLFMRTSRHAEVEIRYVFDLMGKVCQTRWPNLFRDFKVEVVDGIGEWTTPHVKI
jgi:thymidylate synthase (FAD)